MVIFYYLAKKLKLAILKTVVVVEAVDLFKTPSLRFLSGFTYRLMILTNVENLWKQVICFSTS